MILIKISDLQQKEVINIINGRKLGGIKDVVVDAEAGNITAIIIAGNEKFSFFLNRNDDTMINWEQIKKIGLDVVLVKNTGYKET